MPPVLLFGFCDGEDVEDVGGGDGDILPGAVE